MATLCSNPTWPPCVACPGWNARRWCSATCSIITIGSDLPHSPRAILKKQVERLRERGYTGMFASELEFYLFDESYQAIHERNYHKPKTAGHYIEDYNILQTTREEPVLRAIRKHLQASGIPGGKLQG